ncbi:hypothetical protein EJB05_16277, partial [Eragrostis curvula]
MAALKMLLLHRAFPSSQQLIPPHQNLRLQKHHQLRADASPALLVFRAGLTDPGNYLSSWQGEDCCQWKGVRCSNRTGHVVELRLNSLVHIFALRSNNFNAAPIPQAIGGLKNLRYLYLSGSNFSGQVPPQIGNLSKLLYLDMTNIGHGLHIVRSSDLAWLSRLTMLQYLDLSTVNLGKAIDWLHVVNKLPSLVTLNLAQCGLQNSIPPPVHANLTSLEHLDLYGNEFIFSSVGAKNLLWDLPSLLDLDMGRCGLQGSIPEQLGNLTSIMSLYLYENNLSGSLPVLLGHLSNLTILQLDNNRLSGELPLGIGALTKLTELNLGHNNLHGTITESHFGALVNLRDLYLNDNSLAIVFRHNWVPPFKLSTASLKSCKLGPKFPEWLRSQNSIYILDISNTRISAPIPQWFWITFSQTQHLVLSRNQISGMLSPTMFRKMEAETMDFGDNLLVGSMPKLPRKLKSLDLSKNNLSGSLPSDFGAPSLTMLALFKNSISGRIPYYFCHLEKLSFMDLSGNQLNGEFPNCEKRSSSIFMLNLNTNNLSGEFPTFLSKCQDLIFLDLSYNQFSGMLPPWIGDKLPSLALLSLRSNLFFSHIPQQLATMKGLQFLDLACNNMLGPIPQSLANLTAMVVAPQDDNKLSDIGLARALMKMISLVVTKGEQLEFTSGIMSMVNLDLSCNILTGPIPEEIGKLAALKNLNLSRNHLNRTIPDSIGDIHSLESLDLSHNEFGGEIPPNLSNLLSLSHLNLSHNNLTGRIPSGNQLQTLDDQASIYIGNPGLCGPPLSKNCSQTGLPPASPEGNEDGDGTVFFFLAMGSGYVMGLWTIFCLFLFKKNWRIICFLFSDRLYDWVYVQVALGWTIFIRENIEADHEIRITLN